MMSAMQNTHTVLQTCSALSMARALHPEFVVQVPVVQVPVVHVHCTGSNANVTMKDELGR